MLRTLTGKLTKPNGDALANSEVVIRLIDNTTDTPVIAPVATQDATTVSTEKTVFTDSDGFFICQLTPNDKIANYNTRYVITVNGVSNSFIQPDRDAFLRELLIAQESFATPTNQYNVLEGTDGIIGRSFVRLYRLDISGATVPTNSVNVSLGANDTEVIAISHVGSDPTNTTEVTRETNYLKDLVPNASLVLLDQNKIENRIYRILNNLGAQDKGGTTFQIFSCVRAEGSGNAAFSDGETIVINSNFIDIGQIEKDVAEGLPDGTATPLSDSVPQKSLEAEGVAGTSKTAARGDHRHETSRYLHNTRDPIDATDGTNNDTFINTDDNTFWKKINNKWEKIWEIDTTASPFNAEDYFIHLGADDVDGADTGIVAGGLNDFLVTGARENAWLGVQFREGAGTNVPDDVTYTSSDGNLVLSEGSWMLCASIKFEDQTLTNNRPIFVALGVDYGGNIRHANSNFSPNQTNIANKNVLNDIQGLVSVSGVVVSDGTTKTKIAMKFVARQDSDRVHIVGAHLHAFKLFVAEGKTGPKGDSIWVQYSVDGTTWSNETVEGTVYRFIRLAQAETRPANDSSAWSVPIPLSGGGGGGSFTPTKANIYPAVKEILIESDEIELVEDDDESEIEMKIKLDSISTNMIKNKAITEEKLADGLIPDTENLQDQIDGIKQVIHDINAPRAPVDWEDTTTDSEGGIADSPSGFTLSTAKSATYAKSQPGPLAGNWLAIRIPIADEAEQYRFVVEVPDDLGGGTYFELINHLELLGTDDTWQYYISPELGSGDSVKLQLSPDATHVGNTTYLGNLIQRKVYDQVKEIVQPGTNINIRTDDTDGELTISSSGGGGSTTPLSDSTPQGVSDTAASGTGSSASRDDHTHNIDDRVIEGDNIKNATITATQIADNTIKKDNLAEDAQTTANPTGTDGENLTRINIGGENFNIPGSPTTPQVYERMKAVLIGTFNTQVVFEGDDENNQIDVSIGAKTITNTEIADNTITITKLMQNARVNLGEWSTINATATIYRGQIVYHSASFYICHTQHTKSSTGPDADFDNWDLIRNFQDSYQLNTNYHAGAWVMYKDRPALATTDIAPADPAPDASNNTKWFWVPTATSGGGGGASLSDSIPHPTTIDSSDAAAGTANQASRDDHVHEAEGIPTGLNLSLDGTQLTGQINRLGEGAINDTVDLSTIAGGGSSGGGVLAKRTEIAFTAPIEDASPANVLIYDGTDFVIYVYEQTVNGLNATGSNLSLPTDVAAYSNTIKGNYIRIYVFDEANAQGQTRILLFAPDSNNSSSQYISVWYTDVNFSTLTTGNNSVTWTKIGTRYQSATGFGVSFLLRSNFPVVKVSSTDWRFLIGGGQTSGFTIDVFPYNPSTNTFSSITSTTGNGGTSSFQVVYGTIAYHSTAANVADDEYEVIAIGLTSNNSSFQLSWYRTRYNASNNTVSNPTGTRSGRMFIGKSPIFSTTGVAYMGTQKGYPGVNPLFENFLFLYITNRFTNDTYAIAWDEINNRPPTIYSSAVGTDISIGAQIQYPKGMDGNNNMLAFTKQDVAPTELSWTLADNAPDGFSVSGQHIDHDSVLPDQKIFAYVVESSVTKNGTTTILSRAFFDVGHKYDEVKTFTVDDVVYSYEISEDLPLLPDDNKSILISNINVPENTVIRLYALAYTDTPGGGGSTTGGTPDIPRWTNKAWTKGELCYHTDDIVYFCTTNVNAGSTVGPDDDPDHWKSLDTYQGEWESGGRYLTGQVVQVEVGGEPAFYIANVDVEGDTTNPFGNSKWTRIDAVSYSAGDGIVISNQRKIAIKPPALIGGFWGNGSPENPDIEVLRRRDLIVRDTRNTAVSTIEYPGGWSPGGATVPQNGIVLHNDQEHLYEAIDPESSGNAPTGTVPPGIGKFTFAQADINQGALSWSGTWPSNGIDLIVDIDISDFEVGDYINLTATTNNNSLWGSSRTPDRGTRFYGGGDSITHKHTHRYRLRPSGNSLPEGTLIQIYVEAIKEGNPSSAVPVGLFRKGNVSLEYQPDSPTIPKQTYSLGSPTSQTEIPVGETSYIMAPAVSGTDNQTANGLSISASKIKLTQGNKNNVLAELISTTNNTRTFTLEVWSKIDGILDWERKRSYNMTPKTHTSSNPAYHLYFDLGAQIEGQEWAFVATGFPSPYTANSMGAPSLILDTNFDNRFPREVVLAHGLITTENIQNQAGTGPATESAPDAKIRNWSAPATEVSRWERVIVVGEEAGGDQNCWIFDVSAFRFLDKTKNMDVSQRDTWIEQDVKLRRNANGTLQFNPPGSVKIIQAYIEVER